MTLFIVFKLKFSRLFLYLYRYEMRRNVITKRPIIINNNELILNGYN